MIDSKMLWLVATVFGLTACGAQVVGGPDGDVPDGGPGWDEGVDVQPDRLPPPPPPPDGGNGCIGPDNAWLPYGATYTDACQQCICDRTQGLVCRGECLDGGPPPPPPPPWDGGPPPPPPWDGGPPPPPPWDGGLPCYLADGTVLAPGQSRSDGCNSCYCGFDGIASCTGRFCPDGGPPPPPWDGGPPPPPPPWDGGPTGCALPGGGYLPAGQSFTSGCTTCYCQWDGTLSCNSGDCDAGPPPPPSDDAGTQCNDLAPAGFTPPTQLHLRGSPPPASGGFVSQGDYVLTTVTTYGGTMSAPIGPTLMRVTDLGFELASVGSDGVSITRNNVNTRTVGSEWYLTLTCPTPAPTSIPTPFTSDGTQLRLYIYANEVLTFQHLGIR